MVPVLSAAGPREDDLAVPDAGSRDVDRVLPTRGCAGRPIRKRGGSGERVMNVGLGYGESVVDAIRGSDERLRGVGLESVGKPVNVDFDGARGREKFSLCAAAGLGPMPIPANSLTKSSEAGL